MKFRATLLLSTFAAVIASGCYSMHRSSGAGQASFRGPRQVDPFDVALAPGYRIETVATGLTFPTGVTFDADGKVYVVESGYAYGEVWTKPRLLRLERDGKATEIAAGEKDGPWTGVTFHNGAFFVAEGGVLEGGRILRITPDGKITPLISNLPSMGDHHSNGPIIGPDGWLYFGQGTASNSGIIGKDNAQFGWLMRRPGFHDIPGQDITLAGQNFKTSNPFSRGGRATTGAFLPFGVPSARNQVIKGQVPCSGAVMRIRPEGGQPELVAWGFRNPFGLAFSDGRLYVTDNGYDERGSRPIWGAADALWQVKPGVWYGWPDFSAGMPVNQKDFKAPWKKRPQFLLASHPNRPPAPTAIFPVHSSADGFDFSRSEKFGHIGDAFVAVFGDESPSVGKVLHPVGAKVVRVDVRHGLIEEFASIADMKTVPPRKLAAMAWNDR